MKKLAAIALICLLIMTGCTSNEPESLSDEEIIPVAATKATKEPLPDTLTEDQGEQSDVEGGLLNEKMNTINFENISGYFTRKTVQDEVEYIEMFAFEKDTFIRIATHELDREVFAYNYKSDDFTYIYYFDGEMTTKTIMNVATGAVLEDDEGYAELLTQSADELKGYFKDLLEVAGISPDELHY